MKKGLGVGFLFFFILVSGSAYANEKIVILLDWFANPDHAPLFVAKSQGFFAAQQLDVELLGPANPSDPPKLVAANKADIAITYEPDFILQVHQGLPLIRIGTLIDKPLDCLVTLKEGPIKTIEDLKNKRVGYSSGVNHVILKAMLEYHHLALNNIEAINVHYDLTQALLAKKVDAVTGLMRTFEVIQLKLAGHPAHLFLPEENGVPTYSELILVINKNHLKEDKIKKFMIALQQGVTYLKKHPEATWENFSKEHPELNNTLNQRAWFATLPYFADQPSKFNIREWQQFINFMQKNGMISKTKSPSEIAINLLG